MGTYENDREKLVGDASEIDPVPRRLHRVKYAVLVSALVACSLIMTAMMAPWPRWWVAISPWKKVGHIISSSEGPIVQWTDEIDLSSSSRRRRRRRKTAEVDLSGKWGECKKQEVNGPAQDEMYCCTQGNPGSISQSFECSPLCFPGQASVTRRDGSRIAMMDAKVGEAVLVRHPSGMTMYEPILGFLHASRRKSGRQSTFVTVEHAQGTFRASENHVVFVWSEARLKEKIVRELKITDSLAAIANGTAISSLIHSLRSDAAAEGMFAPLTASGTVVVDGVVASNYATVGQLRISHSAMHASFFPMRAYNSLHVGPILAPLWSKLCADGTSFWLCQGTGDSSLRDIDEMHPLPAFYYRILKLDRLLRLT